MFNSKKLFCLVLAKYLMLFSAKNAFFAAKNINSFFDAKEHKIVGFMFSSTKNAFCNEHNHIFYAKESVKNAFLR